MIRQFYIFSVHSCSFLFFVTPLCEQNSFVISVTFIRFEFWIQFIIYL